MSHISKTSEGVESDAKKIDGEKGERNKVSKPKNSQREKVRPTAVWDPTPCGQKILRTVS